MQHNSQESRRQIAYGAIISYVAIGFSIISGLFYTPWVIQTLGVSNYGVYVILTNLMNMVFLDFGLASASNRFIAKYSVEGNQLAADRVSGLIMRLFIYIALLIGVVLFVVFFFLDAIYAGLSSEEVQTLRSVYIIFAVYSVFTFPFMPLDGILIGYEKLIVSKASLLINKVLFVLFVIIALLSGGGVFELVSALILANSIVIIFRFVYIRKKTPLRIQLRFRSKPVLKEVFGFSIWMTVDGIAQRLTLTLAPQILGIVANSTQTAIFGVALVLQGYLYTIVSAVNALFFRMVTSKSQIENAHEGMTDLMIRVGRMQIFIGAAIFIGFVVVGKDFMLLWMNEGFSSAYWCLLLLSIPNVINSAQSIAETYMITNNKVKYGAIINAAILAISFPLALLLGRSYGAIGVSISIFIAFILRIILRNIIIFKNILHLNIVRFIRETYLPVIIPCLLAAASVILFRNFIVIGGWFGFSVDVTLLLVVYCSSVWMLVANQSEKALFKRILLRLK